MKVLSLFDGMSCGQQALKECGIVVDEYYTSEIDKYAIEIAQKNFPNTKQIGDVRTVKAADLPQIDLLLGGSPCQGFSFAGRQLNFNDPRSALFFEFVRVLKECKPKYFLLENVRMKKEYQDVITEHLGVEPIMINSSLVSAQNRVRLYWTNIPNIEQPTERGIVLADVLECEPSNYTIMSDNFTNRLKDNRCLTDLTQEKASNLSAMEYVKNGKQGDYLACNKIGKPIQVGNASDINGHDLLKRIYSPNGKSPTLNAHGGGNTEPKVAIGAALRGRSKDENGKNVDWKSVKPKQELELRKDQKYNTVSSVTKDSLVAFQDIVTLNDNQRKKIEKIVTDTEKSNCVTTAFGRGGSSSEYLTSVKKKTELLKGLHYRKLTPLECERLQTLPDNYTEGVSNTQRYKMIGNGWTIAVITHILNNIKGENHG